MGIESISKLLSDNPINEQLIIQRLFSRISKYHGQILVGTVFGLITRSKQGLSNAELEDIVSCDDLCLDAIFQYWTPPVRMLPSVLWRRIHFEIKEYLVERG